MSYTNAQENLTPPPPMTQSLRPEVHLAHIAPVLA
jgi:hypothetical protein